MKRVWALLAGVLLGIAVAVPVTAVAAGQQQQSSGDAHQEMHAMMDAVMGAGSSAKMHEAMPGSEEMMEQCAQHMENQGPEGMIGDGMMGMMMQATGGVMNMNSGSMRNR